MCADGMGMPMLSESPVATGMPGGASAAVAAGDVAIGLEAGRPIAVPAAGPAHVFEATMPMHSRDGGVLASCLLALVAIVVAVAATGGPRESRSTSRPLRRARVVPRGRVPRPPTLAELCLLRT